MSEFTDLYTADAGILDETFLTKPAIYESRLRLLHKALTTRTDGRGANPGKILSIGVGSGIFEQLLRDVYGIHVAELVEPSPSIGELARAKGFTVAQATAQDCDYAGAPYDTILYNGSSFGFIPDEEIVETFAKNARALAGDGRLVLTDVPAESALGIILRLRAQAHVDDALIEDDLSGTAFFNVTEHAYKPYWHSVAWYREVLEKAGFTRFDYWQSVLVNPRYHDEEPHDPVHGYKSGNYVAVIAEK